MSPALEVTDLSTEISAVTLHRPCGRQRRVSDRARRDGRAGRRVGFGKSMLALSVLGLLPNGGHIISGSIKADGSELVGMREARAAQDSRQRDGDDLPGQPVFAEPDQEDRRAGRRAGPPAPRGLEQGRDRAGAGGAGACRAAATEGASRRLSAPALRRSSSAGDDRDRAVLRAEDSARRRADDGARRDDPGSDPGAARRPAGAVGDGDAARHPRHGRGRRPHQPDQRDVRRADRRDRPDPRAFQQHAPSLYAGAAGLDPAARVGQPQGSDQYSRASRPT